MRFVENYESDILCPNCGRHLIVKTNRLTGSQFLGCAGFPECFHTQPIPEAWIMRAHGQPTLFDDLPDLTFSEDGDLIPTGVLPCGHDRDAIMTTEEGTHYCRICAHGHHGI